jgi:predicted permease
MSFWSRITNVFRGDRVSREIDEELESHIAEAVEDGSTPEEARRAFGSAMRHREASRDQRMAVWLDSLRADAVFGLRQLKNNPVTTGAAVLSLALAMGASISAFRLVDALLLRPLPISEPDRLFVAVRDGLNFRGQRSTSESFSYPLFQQMRSALNGRAELIAASFTSRVDLTYGSDDAMEKAQRQYVSGSMFQALGLRPALGRVFTARDDAKPGAHPYAVISNEYWQRRFAGDKGIVGRKFRLGNDVFEIVGVLEEGFTGTEPGVFIDIFLPTMMNKSATSRDAFWMRILVRPGRDVHQSSLTPAMNSVYRAMEQERAKGFVNFPKHMLQGFPRDGVVLQPASSGASGMQRNYRLSITALGVLVALVLLIACVNIANLMTARAAARSREMALRVSIGAGRARLVRLVMVESAWLALMAGLVGGMFAWWSAPLVLQAINPPDNPARLNLPFDWRLLGFSVLLALGATILFGLAPALRASGVKPVSALKGGDDPHARRRLMHALIGAQVAFCFIVLILGALFVRSYDRLVNQPKGYSSDRLLVLETVTARPVEPELWDQVAAHLRSVPGVESVAFSEWPLMSGEMWNTFISVNSAPPSETLVSLLTVSPGWMETMKVRLLDGRDFRPEDVMPGSAIVNESFARTWFAGTSPLGKSFEVPLPDSTRDRYTIVGLAGDARYDDMRTPIGPTAYLPFRSKDATGQTKLAGRAAFAVKAVNARDQALAGLLRGEVKKARSEFRVSNIRMQQEIDEAHTVRERLLAMLALFFSGTALVLAAVGLYGVLDYSVVQRRREIGIRIAIGARASNVVGRVVRDVALMVLLGGAVGLAVGIAAERYVRVLLFNVKPTDPSMLLIPAVAICCTAVLAAIPAALRALRTDPARLLRAD